MKFGVPERIYMDKGVGLRYRADSAYYLGYMYDMIRNKDKYLKEDENYKPSWCRNSDVTVSYLTAKDNEDVASINVSLRAPSNSTVVEIVVSTYRTLDEGFTIPIEIHYPVAYAITKKDRETTKGKMFDVEFYDADDNLVLALGQYDGWEFRFKAGRFALVKSQLKAKKKKADFDGGCLYCDKAVYEKINGIVYLKCTKYDGKVKETEYMGTAYPEYCKRR